MSEATRGAAEPPLMRFAMGSVGSKVLMAVTGAGLWLFLLAHLAGNTTIYLGRETFNHYSAALHQTPVLLWFVRFCVIVGVPLHFLTGGRAALVNQAARPVAYAHGNRSPARLAARSMILTGLVFLAFFLYHLAHFTWRLTGPMPPPLPSGEFDPYTMVVLGFQQPVIAALYVLGVGLLAVHLSHGLYSMFQHLGLWGRRWTPWLKGAAQIIAYGMCALFASIPVSVLLGVVKP
jgi:succinate dehydrogenase / fumarate reductase, cytochrome b subunit